MFITELLFKAFNTVALLVSVDLMLPTSPNQGIQDCVFRGGLLKTIWCDER